MYSLPCDGDVRTISPSFAATRLVNCTGAHVPMVSGCVENATESASRQTCSVSLKLQHGVVAGEAAMRIGQILVRAERDFQRVVGAVEGKLIASVGIGSAVDVARVVALLLGEGKAGEEVVRSRMDGGEVSCRARRAVPNGKLKLNAHAPRARPAQRCEKARVERVLKCRGLVLH